jgi:glycosyltransferase involved in cell wall biosynthesis
MPKMTIITSVYKADEYIEKFLDNITSQDGFEDCELFLLHVSSVGNEFGVIKEYLGKFDNIIYEPFSRDPGLYACWNHMIKNSTSDYITNANTDDLLLPGCLKRHMDLLDSNPDIDIAYCVNLEVDKPNIDFSELPSYKSYPTAEYSLYNMLMCNLPHNHPVWRRRLHELCGYFDTKYKSAADWDFFLRACSLGYQMKLIPEILGVYYRNPVGISSDISNIDRNFKEVDEVRQKFIKMLSYLSIR